MLNKITSQVAAISLLLSGVSAAQNQAQETTPAPANLSSLQLPKVTQPEISKYLGKDKIKTVEDAQKFAELTEKQITDCHGRVLYFLHEHSSNPSQRLNDFQDSLKDLSLLLEATPVAERKELKKVINRLSDANLVVKDFLAGDYFAEIPYNPKIQNLDPLDVRTQYLKIRPDLTSKDLVKIIDNDIPVQLIAEYKFSNLTCDIFTDALLNQVPAAEVSNFVRTAFSLDDYQLLKKLSVSGFEKMLDTNNYPNKKIPVKLLEKILKSDLENTGKFDHSFRQINETGYDNGLQTLVFTLAKNFTEDQSINILEQYSKFSLGSRAITAACKLKISPKTLDYIEKTHPEISAETYLAIKYKKLRLDDFKSVLAVVPIKERASVTGKLLSMSDSNKILPVKELLLIIKHFGSEALAYGSSTLELYLNKKLPLEQLIPYREIDPTQVTLEDAINLFNNKIPVSYASDFSKSFPDLYVAPNRIASYYHSGITVKEVATLMDTLNQNGAKSVYNLSHDDLSPELIIKTLKEKKVPDLIKLMKLNLNDLLISEIFDHKYDITELQKLSASTGIKLESAIRLGPDVINTWKDFYKSHPEIHSEVSAEDFIHRASRLEMENLKEQEIGKLLVALPSCDEAALKEFQDLKLSIADIKPYQKLIKRFNMHDLEIFSTYGLDPEKIKDWKKVIGLRGIPNKTYYDRALSQGLISEKIKSTLAHYGVEAHMERYPISIIKGLITGNNYDMDKPSALMISTRTDWNAAFGYNPDTYSDLAKKYNVTVYEVGTDDEIREKIITFGEKLAKDGHRINLIWFAGHGTPNSIELSKLPGDTSHLDLTDKNILSELAKYLSADAMAVLESCSTGKQGVENMKSMIEESLGILSYAPEYPTAIQQLIFDENDKLKNVIYFPEKKSTP